MTRLQIIRKADLTEISWKNGGGITRNIATHGDERGMLWRLSMADVTQDGPFSAFDGLTRILTVIEGDGLVLHGPDRDWHAGFAQPVTFDGGTPIMAELTQGPLTDFNLMFDTVRCTSTAQVLSGPATQTIGAEGQTLVVHVITGAADLDRGDTILGVADTAISKNAPHRLTLATGDIALIIGLRPDS